MPEHRIQCPACGSEKSAEVWSRPYSHSYFAALMERFPVVSSERYVLRGCPNCDLHFQELILGQGEDDLNREYWGSQIDTTPTSLRELAHMTEEILIIRQLFADTTPRVLDYGVGKTNWAGIAKGFQCEAWGTDAAEICEKYCDFRGVKWCPLDEIPENKFHFINSDSVFEHIPQPLETLKRLTAALVPGGLLKLNLPGKKNFKKQLTVMRRTQSASIQQLDAFLLHIEPLIHINLFQPANIISMGQLAGLEPYRIPLGLSYSSMVLFNSGRQWNRNVYQPWKRWRSRGTWQFFRKPSGGGA